MRTKTKSKDRVGPLKDPAGNLTEDDNIMCDTLNNFFASVFTQENTDTVPEVLKHNLKTISDNFS